MSWNFDGPSFSVDPYYLHHNQIREKMLKFIISILYCFITNTAEKLQQKTKNKLQKL